MTQDARKNRVSPEAPKGEGPEDSYKVGYGKPPVQSRFKPGNPGRRKGSGKRTCDIADIFTKALTRRRKIRRGDRIVSMPVAEIMIERLIAMATTGSAKDMALLLRLMDKYVPDQLEAAAQEAHVVYHRAANSSVDLPPADLWKDPRK